jgi:RHS repeat-associated protein
MYSRWQRFQAIIAIVAMVPLLSCGGRGGAPSTELDEVDDRSGHLDPIESEVEDLRNQPVSFSPSTPVGTLPGDSSVDQVGQAHYTVPLDVPPGPRGLAPGLAISYSSNGGNGNLGMRFSLAGLSTISRCPKTIADDDAFGAVEWTNDDALCLGGERLVLYAGTHGESGSEYRTRRNPFAKITLTGPIADRASFFEVRTKDGLIHTYGTEAANLVHLQVPGTPGMPWTWGLRFTDDRFGNRIIYDYDTILLPDSHPGELRISRIAYGGIGWDVSRRKIHFDYQSRDDAVDGWFYGAHYGRTTRLQTIRVEGPSGEDLHRYELTYDEDPGTGRSRLREMTKCDRAGVCLPPTLFEWSADEPIGYGAPWAPPCPEEHTQGCEDQLFMEALLVSAKEHLVGDFDGDLDDEILLYHPEHPYTGWWRLKGATPGTETDLEPLSGLPNLSGMPPTNAEVLAQIGSNQGQANQHLHKIQPDFRPWVVDAHGTQADDIVVPLRSFQDAEGTRDQWGHSYAGRFMLMSGGGPVHGFGWGVIDDDSEDHIYAMVPLDHDGDGLEDFWLCRGEGFKSGHWVLALADRNAPGSVYSFHETQVGCSVYDELLVTAMHGGPRQQLLIVPAYETDPAQMQYPGDFSGNKYLTDYDMLPEEDRHTYLELRFEVGGSGALVSTNLPRDLYQRWHDLNCRNAFALKKSPVAIAGHPTMGAGIGHDRQIDVNGDGLVDILRFELLSGDDHSNVANIQAGLGNGNWNSGLMCDVSVAQAAGLKLYVNRGGSYAAGEWARDANGDIIETSGSDHANLWINFIGGQLDDVNNDGRTDFVMMGFGPGTEPSTLTSRGDGTFAVQDVVVLNQGADPNVWPWLFVWPRYTTPNNWSNALGHYQRSRLVSMRYEQGSRRAFATLKEPDEPGSVDWYFKIIDKHPEMPRERVVEIVDGLGGTTRFKTEHGGGWADGFFVNDAPTTYGYPKAPLKTRPPVTTRHEVEGSFVHRYQYLGAVRDRHGRGLVGWQRVLRVRGDTGIGDEVVETRYDLSYDSNLRDYPYAGIPESQAACHPVTLTEAPEATHIQVVNHAATTVEQPISGGMTYFAYADESVARAYAQSEAYADYAYLQASEGARPRCPEPGGSPYEERVVTQQQDGFGTVRLSTVAVTGGDVQTTEVPQVLDDVSEWLVGYPRVVHTTSCTAANDCEYRESTTEYKSGTNAPELVIVEPNRPSLRVESMLSYDSHGNPEAITTVGQVAGQPTTRVATMSWDPEGVTPLEVTDPVGHTTYFVHHPASGVLVAAVDPAGHTMRYTYDGFFRPTKAEQHKSPMGQSDGFPAITTYLFGEELTGVVGTPTSAMRIRNEQSGGGGAITHDLDRLGRTIVTSWRGMAPVQEMPTGVIPPGDEIYVRTWYDWLGRPREVSLPTYMGQSPEGTTKQVYDALDRVLEVIAPNDQSETFEFSHQGSTSKVTHQDQSGQISSANIDKNGRVVLRTDALGTPTCYAHGPFGRLEVVTRACTSGNPVSSTYDFDPYGRVLQESEPSTGTWKYEYNTFGELDVIEDAKGTFTTFERDAAGRVESKQDADGETIFWWDNAGKGKLARADSPDGVVKLFMYDDFGRVREERTIGPWFAIVNFTYGAGDRLETIEYPVDNLDPSMQLKIRYAYDAAGHLRALVDDGDQSTYWLAESANEAGQLLAESVLGGVRTVRIYEPKTLRPSAISTDDPGGTKLQRLEYLWHPWGELQARFDVSAPNPNEHQWETFTYDALHRLSTAIVEHPVSGTYGVNFLYDLLGNITFKRDVGSYTYEQGTGRLASYGWTSTAVLHDANGNVRSKGDDLYTYTAFDKVRTIDVDGAVSTFDYDAFGDRVRRVSGAETTVTLGNLYEIRLDDGEGTISTRRRLAANGRVVGQIAQDGVWNPEASMFDIVTRFESLHDDHLGSTTMVASQGGTATQRFAYDAWGRARNADNWITPLGDGQAAEAGIGFTGHPAELDGGLINMGGRMYDPVIARFTSADPVTEDIYDAQTYNRYSYVINRPLVFTDPSGYHITTADGCAGGKCGAWWVAGFGKDGASGDAGMSSGIDDMSRDLSRRHQNSVGNSGPPAAMDPFQRSYDPSGDRHMKHGAFRHPSRRDYSPTVTFTQVAGDRGGCSGPICDGTKAMLENRPDQSTEHDARRQETSRRVVQQFRSSNTYAMAESAAIVIALGLFVGFAAAVEVGYIVHASGSGIVAVETSKLAAVAAAAARGGAQNAANALRLGKQLASEAGSAELFAGGGKVMAGAGARTPIRDVARLTSEYGGKPGDWAKVTSGTHKFSDLTTIEVHGYRNVATGQVVELKSKIGTWSP